MHLYRKIRKSFWAPGKTLYPDQEFLAIKAECEDIVRMIEKTHPIILNLKELKQYMDITWEDFFSYTEEDQMYYMRDNLFYYILKSRNKSYHPLINWN